MRAAVLTAPGRIELRDVDPPAAPSGSTTVRVRAVGICGTDVGIFRGAIRVAHPRVLGHEVVGEVAASPDGVFDAGARVVVDPVLGCGRCARCLEGRSNLCADGGLLGRDRDGALREAIDVPTANVHAIPDAVGDDVAPLVQVLTTCVHALRRAPIAPGESVVVVGLGVTGQLHVQLARLAGAGTVIGVTRSRDRRRLAERFGADATIPGDDPSAVDLTREATGGGADLVIECAGTVETLGQAVRIARPGGRVLAYGTIAEAAGTFPFYDLYFKELALTGARAAAPEDFPVAIDAVASGRVRLDPLVARRVPLGEVGPALAGGPASGLKTIVEVGGGPFG